MTKIANHNYIHTRHLIKSRFSLSHIYTWIAILSHTSEYVLIFNSESGQESVSFTVNMCLSLL